MTKHPFSRTGESFCRSCLAKVCQKGLEGRRWRLGAPGWHLTNCSIPAESGRANLEGWEREGRGGEGRRGAGGGSTPLHNPHKEEKKVGVYTAGFPSSWKSQGGSNAGSAELSVPHPLLGLR